MIKTGLFIFLFASLLASGAAAQGFDAENRYVVSAEYIHSSHNARWRNQADSILTWQDIRLGGAMLGVEKNGYGAKLWYADGDGGYSSDDDLYNKFYAVSAFDVDTRYFGFDAWAPLEMRSPVKARWGMELSSLAFKGYVRMAAQGKPAAGTDKFPMDTVEYADGAESEDYSFNSIIPYVGANVIIGQSENGKHTFHLDGRVGAGLFYGRQKWLVPSGKTGISTTTFALPMLQFKTEATYDYAIFSRMSLGLAMGYKGAVLAGIDSSTVTANKDVLGPNDPRKDGPAKQIGRVLKDLSTNEFYSRVGVRFSI
ncbi:MAG: hypothetical protein LBJ73_01805 [Rickettsiales bacterium]|jgi:hypothetical protein|nr:hypothetical protein [Rickettsiales bacterium]